MKPIRLTPHALEQCEERGATEEGVRYAIEQGISEPAKRGREMYRFNFDYGNTWQGVWYAIKQVAPIIKEERGEIAVITVYTFYF
jgi:hypothetical protein